MRRSKHAQRVHRRRERNRYYQRLSRGLCGRCGKFKVEPGIAVCLACRVSDEERRLRLGRESDNRLRRTRRARRVAAGRCPNCAEPSSPGYRLCDQCRQKNRDYYRSTTAPLRRSLEVMSRLCSGCRRATPDPGYRTCLKCRKASNEYYHRRGKTLRQEHRRGPGLVAGE